MAAPGNAVHGALFEAPEQELLDMAVDEGIYIGDYQRRTFICIGEDGNQYSVEFYQVIDPQGPFKPSKAYVEDMLKGARELDLDPDHIKVVEQFYAGSI